MGYLQELSTGQSETARGLLQDAVDPHVHSGPSMAPRATDHIQLAEMLSEAGFRAAVTKDHD